MYCHISYISLNLIQIQRTIAHGDEDKCKCRKTFPQLKAKKNCIWNRQWKILEQSLGGKEVSISTYGFTIT